jgi:hypothetical protein
MLYFPFISKLLVFSLIPKVMGTKMNIMHLKTPKFNAIRDFLNTRFNYNIIDIPHENII